MPEPGAVKDVYGVTDVLVGLARTLRAAGVDAAPDRVHTFHEALVGLDAGKRDDVYWAGRLTLCSTADDLARYDSAFAVYFGERPNTIVKRPVVAKVQTQSMALPDAEPGDGDESGDD